MKTKICSKCKKRKGIDKFTINKIKLDGLAGHCKKCNREYQNKWRKTRSAKTSQKLSRIKNKLKIKAQQALHRALKKKELKKESNCFLCGATKNLEAHHIDYKYLLKVIWLCRKCHKRLHRK